MPKRITQSGVIVQRPGADDKPKNFRPPIGKVFDYTKEEIDEINAVNPDALAMPGDVEEATVEGSRAKPAAGNKPAAANKSTANAADL